MKYMCTWSIAPEKKIAITERFKENAEPMDGVKQLGRWFSLGTTKGFRLIEADDPKAVKKMTRYWEDLGDFEIWPVLDEEENMESMSG